MTHLDATERHESLERMRTERPRIADAEVDAILDRLTASGIVDLVEPWVRRHHGRRRTLAARALLAGMFLAASRNDGRVTLTAVTSPEASFTEKTMVGCTRSSCCRRRVQSSRSRLGHEGSSHLRRSSLA